MTAIINGFEKLKPTCLNCKWFVKNKNDFAGDSGMCTALPPIPVATLDRINFMRCATEAKNLCALWEEK